jgi:F-type H+-transporting ATPase subunit delta
MKKYRTKQYAVALSNVLEQANTDNETKTIIENFVALLAKNKLLKKSNQIIGELIKCENEKNGIVCAEIISARPLAEKIISKINNFFGNKAILNKKIDPSLIGGAIIKTNDYIIDGTVLKQINYLKQKLI